MSVHYSSRLGYGFIVQRQEYREFPEEKFHEFQRSDYAFAIDGWDPDNSTYFFGFMMNAADPSEYFMIPSVIFSYDHDDKLMKMIDEYKSLFPGKDSYMPHNYVLSCVD